MTDKKETGKSDKKEDTSKKVTCTYKGEKYSEGAEVVMSGQRKYCDSVGDWVDM